MSAPYEIGPDHRQLAVGERQRKGDERKSGMLDGRWEPLPIGEFGRRVDGSMTVRRALRLATLRRKLQRLSTVSPSFRGRYHRLSAEMARLEAQPA